jgi:hypothetical protein
MKEKSRHDTETHIPQFTFAFFAISLIERLKNVEFIYNSTFLDGFLAKTHE